MSRPWTKAEDRILRTRYPHEATAPIAKALGRTASATYQRARILGLEKTEAYLAGPTSGRGNLQNGPRFPKGNVPWNAGLKGWNPPGSEKGHFKKGNKPQTTLPVGTEIIDPDGYRWVKVRESKIRKKRWKMVHVLLWERLRGRIPKGKFLAFKNRDKTDIRLGNLVLVDRAAHMKRNTLQRYPKAIVRATLQIGWLNRLIRERLRNANG